jgi:hypothetical protein
MGHTDGPDFWDRPGPVKLASRKKQIGSPWFVNLLIEFEFSPFLVAPFRKRFRRLGHGIRTNP